jgi:Kip1 ubiquitination-promoting complex protein 1
VGDTSDSFAYDGKRVKVWRLEAKPYGEAWSSGDVIGVGLDLGAGSASFWRNGKPLGACASARPGIQSRQSWAPRALRIPRRPGLAPTRSPLPRPSAGVAVEGIGLTSGAAFFPGASMSAGERCAFNFGARPLVHPPPGYAPIQAPPPAATVELADRCARRLERLAHLALAWRQARAVAAVANASVEVEVDDESGGSRRFDSLPPLDSALCGGDIALLSSLIARSAAPLLAKPFTVHSALLPALLRLHRRGVPHRPVLLHAALDLLELALPRAAFDAAVAALADAAAWCAPIEPLSAAADRATHAAALQPYTALVAAMAGHCGARRALLAHPGAADGALKAAPMAGAPCRRRCRWSCGAAASHLCSPLTRFSYPPFQTL